MRDSDHGSRSRLNRCFLRFSRTIPATSGSGRDSDRWFIRPPRLARPAWSLATPIATPGTRKPATAAALSRGAGVDAPATTPIDAAGYRGLGWNVARAPSAPW
jgi:hypothetical protein